MITSPDLQSIAEAMGVRWQRHDGGPKGFYYHPSRTISTRRGLTIAEYRSTFAHELGHAHHRDVQQTNGYYNTRQEKRADRYAADLLLDEGAVRTALACNGGHIVPAAYELEVTAHILRVWLEHHKA